MTENDLKALADEIRQEQVLELQERMKAAFEALKLRQLKGYYFPRTGLGNKFDLSDTDCGCHCAGGCGDPYAACAEHVPF